MSAGPDALVFSIWARYALLFEGESSFPIWFYVGSKTLCLPLEGSSGHGLGVRAMVSSSDGQGQCQISWRGLFSLILYLLLTV